MEEIIGYIAGTCTTLCYIPQFMQTIKTKSVKDVSLWMYILLFIGVSGWEWYGIILGSVPMMLFNGISLVFVGLILGIKIKTELEK